MPSIEAMLMTLAGRSALAATLSAGCSAWVRKNGVLRLRSITLSQPFSGKASNSAAHAAPALFTRMSSFPSRAGEGGSERLHALDGRDVRRDGEAGAALLRQLRRGPVALRGLARRDVDPRALRKKAPRNHLADAARTAGHQRRAALEREQISHHWRASSPSHVSRPCPQAVPVASPARPAPSPARPQLDRSLAYIKSAFGRRGAAAPVFVVASWQHDSRKSRNSP